MKKIFAVFICMGFMLASLAGCGGPASSSTSGSSDQDIFGQVTTIDGSNITLALISTPNGTSGDYQGGGRQSGQGPRGSFRPRTSGQGRYDGGPFPSGGTRGGMELSGETKTISVTDAAVITKGGMGWGQQDTSPAPALLSDITVGSYLSVTMSGDTVASVTILQFRGRSGNAEASPSPTALPSPSSTDSLSPTPTASPSPGDSAAPGLGTKLG